MLLICKICTFFLLVIVINAILIEITESWADINYRILIIEFLKLLVFAFLSNRSSLENQYKTFILSQV